MLTGMALYYICKPGFDPEENDWHTKMLVMRKGREVCAVSN